MRNLCKGILVACLLSTLSGCGEDSITVIPHEEEDTTTQAQSLKPWLLEVGSFGTKSAGETGVGTHVVMFQGNSITYTVVKGALFGDLLLDMKIGTFTLKGNSLRAHYTGEGVGWLLDENIRSYMDIDEYVTYIIRKDGDKLVMNGRFFQRW